MAARGLPKRFHHNKGITIMFRQDQYDKIQLMALREGEYISTWARKILEQYVEKMLADNPDLIHELNALKQELLETA